MISRRSAVLGVSMAGVGLRPPLTVDRGARPVSEFLASIGVNVHLGTSAYSEAFASSVLPRLCALKVKNIRDGLARDEIDAARIVTLFTKAKVRATLICSPTTHSPMAAIKLVSRRLGPAVVAGIEGINEPDGWFSKQLSAGNDWARTAVDYQRDLFRASKVSPSLASVPILGPAVIDIGHVDVLAGTAAYSDIATIHPYPGGRKPETKGWGDLQRGFGYGSLEWSIANAMPRLQIGKPIVVTETGYHNAVESISSHPGVPESVAAIYLPRLFLYYFSKGITRTFSYELLDERDAPSDPEACFGLLRWDGTPKPAFTALQTLIGLLSSSRSNQVAVGHLKITVSASRPVESVLLQMNNREYFLAIWVPDSIWDPTTRQHEQHLPVTVQITAGQDLRDAAVAQLDRNAGWTKLPLAGRCIEIEANTAVQIILINVA